MPELPEVETTLRGISKKILNKEIKTFDLRTEKLRWPIDKGLKKFLKNKIIKEQVPSKKHEHWDINFVDGWTLRYTDVRKFGALIKITSDPEDHKLLKNLGPEPLGNYFNGLYLFEKTRKKTNFIKDHE